MVLSSFAQRTKPLHSPHRGRVLRCAAAAAPGKPSRPGDKSAASGPPRPAQKEKIYVGKGKYVEDDVSKYPGKNENLTAGGWAGGEKGLQAFRAKLGDAKPPPEVWTKGPNAPRKTLPKELDVNLKKDFGLMAGGFPGGEVGLSSFLDSGKIPKRANPPSVGAGAVVAVAAAVAVSAGVYVTGSLDPEVLISSFPKPTADGLRLAAKIAPPLAAAAGSVALVVAARNAVSGLGTALKNGAIAAAFFAAVAATAGKIVGAW